MKSKPVIFHADDYAANEEISEHILDCYREGVLNSLSILTELVPLFGLYK